MFSVPIHFSFPAASFATREWIQARVQVHAWFLTGSFFLFWAIFLLLSHGVSISSNLWGWRYRTLCYCG